MPSEIRLWEVRGTTLQECPQVALDVEARLEDWLAEDIGVLDPDLLLIGRQVETDFGGIIDLLCIEQSGNLVIVELKRDKTPREVTAQALDYASWVDGLSGERITSVADSHFRQNGALEERFREQFGEDLPDTLNQEHRLLIVASEVDPSSERIIKR